MEFKDIRSINDLKRDVLEEFISTLPKEDKENIKAFLKEHPQKNAAGVFTTVRAYVFNTYFKTTPVRDKHSITFAEVLGDLLNTDTTEEES